MKICTSSKTSLLTTPQNEKLKNSNSTSSLYISLKLCLFQGIYFQNIVAISSSHYMYSYVYIYSVVTDHQLGWLFQLKSIHHPSYKPHLTSICTIVWFKINLTLFKKSHFLYSSKIHGHSKLETVACIWRWFLMLHPFSNIGESVAKDHGIQFLLELPNKNCECTPRRSSEVAIEKWLILDN